MRSVTLFTVFVFLSYISLAQLPKKGKHGAKTLRIEKSRADTAIYIFDDKGGKSILTQVFKKDERPYIHPIIAPDGKGVLTQYRPPHHLHQTGIYWGLKLVNGRDYFMKWQNDYWRGVSATVIQAKGKQVKWQTVYDMLDEKGNTVIVETQNWTMQEYNGKYVMDLEWRGEAKMDVTMGKFYVGGLFIRMPWVKESIGEIINSAGQRNLAGEGQRAIWSDVGVKVDGRDDLAHIAIFDHPDNKGFPTPWRVDSQLGIGPSRQILGDWKLAKGETEVVRYRLLIYTGNLNKTEVTNSWKEFILDY